MPYTPPAGNAVNFNFAGPYSAPGGNHVIFNFGGTPPPPALALPTGLRLALNGDDGWMPSPPRRFAAPAQASSMLLPWMRPRNPDSLFADEEWSSMQRRRFAPIPVLSNYTARAIVFVIA